MIDLAQRSEPYEIALPYGLLVTVKPLTTARMAAAQAAARRPLHAGQTGEAVVMRLAPRSIAGRITLVLIGGLVLTLVASIGVASIDHLFDDDHLQYPRLVGRMATVAAIAGSVPAERRPELLERVVRPPLDAQWSPTAQPPAEAAQDWRSRHLSRDLQQALGDLGPAAIVIDDSPAAEVAAWLQLGDGTWLTVTVDREALGSLWLLRFGLGLSVLTGGIALLAVWAARRVTVPLGRFAQAAGRLGTDVNAPPMAEAGPSEIVQAARAFNQMQERIQRLVDDRTRMLAAIAHDLRTALTRLRLRAELIDDAEQQRKAIADLDAMATMLDETLAFARDDSAGEARQDVDLAVLVRSLRDDLADVEWRPLRYHCRTMSHEYAWRKHSDVVRYRVIRSFRDRRTAALFEGRYVRTVDRRIIARARRKLQVIHAASSLAELGAVPGNRLEPLHGDRNGQHSIRINDQWRICFVWRDGEAHDVEFADYH